MDEIDTDIFEGPGQMEFLKEDYFALEEDDIVEYEVDLELGSDAEDEESLTIEVGYGEKEEFHKLNKAEQVRMMHLRSHLNQLTDKVKQHQYLTEKTREELKLCRGRINQLETERDQVFSQIQNAENDGNTSALYRLRSQHERVCTELDSEQDLETVISERLETEEYDLAKVEVERGKLLLAEHELIQKEQKLVMEKTELALDRLKKEEKYARRAAVKRKQNERNQIEALKEKERRYIRCLEEAKMSKEKHKKYLNSTIDKLRQRREDESIRYKEDMQRKMDMILKLKNDITSNRENLRAIRARDQAFGKEENKQIELERQRILSEGGNPEEVMLVKQKLNKLQKQRQQFELEQQERQAEIMQNIIQEEDRMQKRKKQMPQLWDDPKREKSKIVSEHKKKPLKIFKELTDASIFDYEELDRADSKQEKEYELEEKRRLEADTIHLQSHPPEERVVTDTSDSSHTDSEDEDNQNLAKPEFEGLWDQHKPYKVPSETESSLRLPGATKMDKDIMQRVLEQHRDGIVVKQVAAGREFTGCPFYSKPDVIHFKDIVVGKAYKKRVTLTNVSYSVNYCKYVGITEMLKDFIEIQFDPPGQMSAGLTCEMFVTFKPMINEDLEGKVDFLSQTGPFSIPLKCTTKKCDLMVDTNTVQFGSTVIGETLKRSFILSNKGALGTKFEFFKVTGMKGRTVTSVETSLGRLTTADTVRDASPGSENVPEKSKKEVTASLDKTESKKTVGEDVEKLGVPVLQDEQSSQEGGLAPVEEVPPGSRGEAEDGSIDADEGLVAASDLTVSEMDDYGALDGMKVGPIQSGDIGPFSDIRLEIIWQPTVPDKVDSEFLITFANSISDNISVIALGNAIDVPVWVPRKNIDLKICMYDRLYQDTIIVHNRAKTALRLKFEVCKELRNHMELLPKTGYIQAQSQFSAQLKFLPRTNLSEEASKYFDKETGVLEASMIITVADQTQPVPFTVQAVVTNSDMEFDMTEIDFGHCTIYETAKKTIQLTNTSILPQEYGFVGLADYVEVQPNDGFGTLLPLETIQLDVLFSPKKAKDYKFELNCQSVINREFKIQCKGIGVHPPLELSSQVVHFAATALYDVSAASLHVINSHTSTNEFTHPVPRIGKGDIVPVGPTSFEFVLPEDSTITISPSVGTIDPGKKCHVQVRFTPRLRDKEIRREAVRLATKMLQAKAQKEYKDAIQREKETDEQAAQKTAGRKKSAAGKKPPGKGKGTGGLTPTGANLTVTGPQPITPPTVDSITKESPEYAAAISSLLRQHRGSFKSYVVPCYVASGACSNPGELPYSVHNTLYLEIHCPTVKPAVVVISDNGKTSLDFGDVSLGQNIIKSVTIQNISDKVVELSSSVLDTNGPFLMLNSLRILPPDVSHTVLLSFTPTAGKVFHEVLEVQCTTATLHITLTGKGVSPLVQLTTPMEGGVFDMSAVLVDEYVEKPFKMQNTSSLSIEYSMKLESLSLLRHSKAQGLPAFVQREKKTKPLVGAQNHNGQNVFDLVPSEGTIPPGETIEVLVTFAPDHASDHYFDVVRIELFGKEESHCFRLIGTSKSHIMFIDGVDERFPEVESLAEKLVILTEEEEMKILPTPVLCTLHSIAKDNEYIPASREISIGCVRTMAVSQKKNGEFQFENVQQIVSKGFNIDPQKGMVEAGTVKTVTITWTPPPGHDPNQTVETSLLITMKGDVTEQYKLMLHAMILSD